jgi:NadR type nicotinamide-nucleotide adenylyltransferase
MKTHRIGVMVGKFLPLTKGHEVMIDFARSQLDELIIIVSSNDSSASSKGMPSLCERAVIIDGKYGGNNVSVIAVTDTIGDPKSYDLHGTSTDEDFWNKWVEVFSEFAPDATHFVSSDRYGKEAARRLGLKWMPVDPDRQVIDISATKVRDANSSMFTCLGGTKAFRNISDSFKPILAKKFVVVGAESSGKSTVVADLARRFGTSYAPEYGRILSEARDNDLDADDFDDIVSGQHVLNDAAAIASDGIYFVDTEAFTTYLYATVYGVQPSDRIFQMARQETCAGVIFIPPVLNWVDDGTRVMAGSAERQKFYDELVILFEKHKLCGGDTPSMVLSSTDRAERVTEVEDWIYDLADSNNE